MEFGKDLQVILSQANEFIQRLSNGLIESCSNNYLPCASSVLVEVCNALEMDSKLHIMKVKGKVGSSINFNSRVKSADHRRKEKVR